MRTGLKSLDESFTAKILSLVLVLIAAVYGLSYGLNLYINNMSEPVNEDAHYPEEAFQQLYENYDPEKTRLPEGNLRNLSGSNLEKRLRISGIGLIDTARAGGEVIEAIQQDNSTKPKYSGRIEVSKCNSESKKDSFTFCRENTSYPAGFSKTYKGWLILANSIGSIDVIQQNETINNEFSDFVERATFYDSYLVKGFNQKPIESAHYSSKSGLYLVGSEGGPVYVDGEKISSENVSNRGNFRNIDVKLEPGFHKIRKDDFSLRMPVYGFKPEFAERSNGTFVIEGSENESVFFNKIVVEGNNWSREYNLTEDRIILEASKEPVYVSFVRGNFTVTEAVEERFAEDERPLSGVSFGMSENEFEEFMWLNEKISIFTDNLPGISSPQDQSRDLQTRQLTS